MDAFIDLVRELFPTSIKPFTADRAKESLKQFRKDNKFGQNSVGLGKEYDFFDSTTVDFFRQGDIISEIPFLYLDNNGKQQRMLCKAMLLSNTCDADRDEYLHFAPLVPIDKIANYLDDETKRNNFIKDIKDNRIFKFLYLPHVKLQNYAVNFHLITSFPRNIIVEKMNDNVIKKELSLNTIGFYLLLCKLTVYFMREEKPEETKRAKSELA